MSTGPIDELGDLIASARALTEDASIRGAREEIVSGESLPAARAAARRLDWSALASSARSSGVSAGTRLQQIREEIGDCRRCGLCKERRNIVFGVGDPEADLVVIGEAPGYNEDQQGEPFVGPAGQMLDKMLENVLSLRRDQVYIMNVVKCRPPKNRNPLPDEVDSCRPFLDAQFETIAPKVALVLGSVAFRTLFSTEEGITRRRGRFLEYGSVPVMPTFHPAYLLRTPEDKRFTFEDLKLLRARYDDLGGKR